MYFVQFIFVLTALELLCYHVLQLDFVVDTIDNLLNETGIDKEKYFVLDFIVFIFTAYLIVSN